MQASRRFARGGDGVRARTGSRAALPAGFDSHLAKPFTAHDLVDKRAPTRSRQRPSGERSTGIRTLLTHVVVQPHRR